ncbi:hypothetical protein BKM23_04150 [Pseudomonas syringae pv. syringae]|nr:hypothetical protein BKM23_04150 [Pseudomonas syringae pv. syringae]
MLNGSLQQLICRRFHIGKRGSDFHVRQSENVGTFVEYSHARISYFKRFFHTCVFAVLLVKQAERDGLSLLKFMPDILQFKFFGQLALFKLRSQRFKPLFVISHDSQSSIACKGSV